MRIIAGTLKGKTLTTPLGDATRPTADRARQALFDIIMHAPWGGHHLIDGATILDGFAGTGALGLEALSRGAGFAHFIERDKAALAALRTNIQACKLTTTRVWQSDILAPPPGPPCRLVFLDPPYRQSLIQQAIPKLHAAGWITPATIIAAEIARDEPACTDQPLLATRSHGAAQFLIWQHA